MSYMLENETPHIQSLASILPARISQVKVFLKSGLDIGGSLYITINRNRGSKTCKSYFCIFVC